jgi:Na+/H+ antiporter NhaD/arsenite permease-like protein
LSFNDFLVHLAPVALIALVAFVATLPLLFRGTFGVHTDRVAEVMSLNERERSAMSGFSRSRVWCWSA